MKRRVWKSWTSWMNFNWLLAIYLLNIEFRLLNKSFSFCQEDYFKYSGCLLAQTDPPVTLTNFNWQLAIFLLNMQFRLLNPIQAGLFLQHIQPGGGSYWPPLLKLLEMQKCANIYSFPKLYIICSLHDKNGLSTPKSEKVMAIFNFHKIS